MTIYTTKKFRTLSCLLCRHEISITNFSRHVKSGKCNKEKTCRYCDSALSTFNDPANHVNWCSLRPDLSEIKKRRGDLLNASWKTHHGERVSKSKATKLKKYGDENYCNVDQIKETKLANHGDEGFNNRPKSIITCNIIYGCDNPNQNENVKAKILSTNNEKYGVDYAFLLPENRPKDTNRHKAIETMIERYGVAYSAQHPVILAKMQSHRSTNKTFEFPSGNMYTVQGYEPFAIQELLDKGYLEVDIQLTNRKAINYSFNNKISYYHPDIIIPKENRIIEVKSKYWFEREYDKNIAKQSACILQGYLFEFKIY